MLAVGGPRFEAVVPRFQVRQGWAVYLHVEPAVDSRPERHVAERKGVSRDVLLVFQVGVEYGQGVRRRPDGGGYLVRVPVPAGAVRIRPCTAPLKAGEMVPSW